MIGLAFYISCFLAVSCSFPLSASLVSLGSLVSTWAKKCSIYLNFKEKYRFPCCLALPNTDALFILSLHPGIKKKLLVFISSCHHQEAIIQIMKMRKKITNAQLQTELVEILKNMFLPQKKMIKEQIEWLIEHKYIRRDESDINTFIYMA